MSKQTIFPEVGPKPQGPYSPAVVFNDLVFVSGQGPVDPKTGEIVKGDVLEEAKIAIENVRLVLEASGSSLDKVLKSNLYLEDMDDFAKVNELYKEHFGPDYPARTTIQAGRLPLGIKFEIDVIACK